MPVQTTYYPYQQNHYHPQAYGYIGAMQKSCNIGDVCKYYTARFYKPRNGFVWNGSPVNIPRDGWAIIQGAIWLSRPSLSGSTYTTPAYLSTESLDISTLSTVTTASKVGVEAHLHTQTFRFNGTTGANTSSIWIGYVTLKTGWMGYQYETDSDFIWFPPRSRRNGLWLEFDTGSIAPGINPATIIITNWSPIANHNTENSAFITWNSVSNQSSTVVANANGTNTGTYTNGDASGTNRKKPASVSVGSGSRFNYRATRSNALPSSAYDEVTVFTYTYPTLSNLKYDSPAFTTQNNIINANHLLKLSWGSNSPENDGKSSSNRKGTSKSTSDKHKTVLKIKNSNTTEVNNTSSGTSVQKSADIPATSLQKYVPFNSSKPLGENVTLTLTKSHVNDIGITNSVLTKQLTVRYIPTEEIQWPTTGGQTGFTLNNTYPTGSILQENSVVDKDPNNSIWVSFTYPAGEYGIVNGYEVRVKSQDGTWFGPYTYPTNPRTDIVASTSANVRIPTSDIKFGMQNKVYVRPFYLHTDGQRYYGPEVEKGFPSVITKLSTPSIIYPANASEWINKNYRVLFTLPADGDWSDYTDSIKNGYRYRDLQIEVNGVIYSYKNNPEIFSISPLAPHKAKIVINPSLMSTYPNATSYTFRVRVRKNYGYLDSQESASWSLWSAARVVTVKPASFNVSKGDYIMASHYNLLKPLMLRMRNTYPDYMISTTTVSVGDYIEADGFVNPYKDILQCFNLVNGWGTYHKDRNSVKFNKGVNIPKFEPVVGEYITAMRQDKIYNLSPGIYDGRNYIGIMFDDANLCK